MTYRHFPSASGKYIIEGPGVIPGFISIKDESQAYEICQALTKAFKAGKTSKAQEIKRALEE